MTALRHSQASLFDLEQVIERGMQTFVEVGLALMEVRDRKLYEEAGYVNFEMYCSGRWGFKRSRGEQLISAAKVAVELSEGDVTKVTPLNERQARAIAPLAKKDPEAARTVLRDVSSQNQHVTASRLREAVREHFGDDSGDEASERYPEIAHYPKPEKAKATKYLDTLPEPEREQKREELKDLRSDAHAEVTGNPPLPKDMPYPGDDPALKWTESLNKLHTRFRILRDRNGAMLAASWGDYNRNLYLSELNALRSELDAWIALIEQEQSNAAHVA